MHELTSLRVGAQAVLHLNGLNGVTGTLCAKSIPLSTNSNIADGRRAEDASYHEIVVSNVVDHLVRLRKFEFQ